MINIVLFQPEIPHNTGAIARTCALTGSRLHLIKPLGFDISDKAIKRSGLDYWPLVDLYVYEDIEDFIKKNDDPKVYVSTTKAKKLYTEFEYKDNDYIMFGRETSGVTDYIRNRYHDRLIRIPMIPELKRSLNLANSASIVLYEALRQLEFPFDNR